MASNATPATNVQALNNWLQQANGVPPNITWEEKQEGPTHAVVWTATVLVEGTAMGTASAPIKRHARDGAAQIALAALQAAYLSGPPAATAAAAEE